MILIGGAYLTHVSDAAEKAVVRVSAVERSNALVKQQVEQIADDVKKIEKHAESINAAVAALVKLTTENTKDLEYNNLEHIKIIKRMDQMEIRANIQKKTDN